jgi:hypothetical protein
MGSYDIFINSNLSSNVIMHAIFNISLNRTMANFDYKILSSYLFWFSHTAVLMFILKATH